MMFTSSSHFVSKLLSVFFFPFSCNGRNNNNNQVTKHTVVNTKQKKSFFFSAYTDESFKVNSNYRRPDWSSSLSLRPQEYKN